MSDPTPPPVPEPQVPEPQIPTPEEIPNPPAPDVVAPPVHDIPADSVGDSVAEAASPFTKPVFEAAAPPPPPPPPPAPEPIPAPPPAPVVAAAAPSQWPAAPAYASAAPAPAPAPTVSTGQTSSNAIISLILAVGSWAICPLILAIIALVFANMASKEIAASGGQVQGAGLVTASKIVAWINIGLWAALAIIFVFVLIIAAIASGTS